MQKTCESVTCRKTEVKRKPTIDMTRSCKAPGSWTAVVVSLTGAPQLRFIDDDGVQCARLAFGMLLQPEVGDTVLVGSDGTTCWILQVLCRTGVPRARIAVPGANCLHIEAPQLSLCGDRTLHLETPKLSLVAASAELRVGVLHGVARSVQFVAGRLQVWAHFLQSCARTISVSADQRMTRVARSDTLEARDLRLSGEQIAELHGRQVRIKADENVLIDGNKILMG